MYQRKTYYVEAWRFQIGEVQPDWVEGLVAEGLVASHPQFSDKLSIQADNVTARLDEGDWLVMEPATGQISIVPDDKFSELYMEVPGPRD